MYCVNCNDSVTIRDEREGLVHKNGRYGCRTKSDGKLTVAQVVDAAALTRLRVSVSVKVPERNNQPAPVRKGRSNGKDEFDDGRFV